MTKLSRTQRHRTDRRIGRVGGSLVGILLLPCALPIGIVVWILGSVIALAALVVLILAVVAMIPIAGAVAVVGAVTVPVTAVYLLTIGFLATGMILMAQRAWAWSLSVRTWVTAGLARRGERVAPANVPTTIDAAQGTEPFRARPARVGSARRLALGMPRARPAGESKFLSGAKLPGLSFDVRETSAFRGSYTRRDLGT